MNILVAPDSFKGSLSASQVSAALSRGLQQTFVQANIKTFPLADGGEGTLEALAGAGGYFQEVTTEVAAGYERKTKILWLDESSVALEVAQTVGIEDLKPNSPDVMHRHSGATGEQLRMILEKGAEKIWIGLGGSCTSDGGLGLLCELGLTLLDVDGQNLEAFPYNLGHVHSILWNPHPLLSDVDMTILSDVENPLCGPRGACAVFGPQKGLAQGDIPELDANIEKIYATLEKQTGLAVRQLKGAGAAGGLGAALLACGANLRPGADVLFEILQFDRQLAWADVIITGEGRSDLQTLQGKLPQRLAMAGQQEDIPVYLISGCLERQAHSELLKTFAGVWSISDGPMSLTEALRDGEILLEMAGANLGKILDRQASKNTSSS